MKTASLYPIRAVAKIVGMTSDSIRSWERRYEAIKPARSRGRRLYSDEDVQRLILLKQAVDQGHRIGQIARLGDGALKELPRQTSEEEERLEQQKKMQEHQINQIIGYLEAYDALGADRILASMAALQPTKDFIYGQVLPLMRLLGDYWVSGRLGVAQEHMLSSIMRGVLSTLLRINNGNSRQKIIFTTLPGERHEFGILSAAMLTAGSGVTAIYLGPDLPVEEMLLAQKKTGASALVLSSIPNKEKNEAHLESLRTLFKGLPTDVDVILGGPITSEVEVAANAFKFHTFKEMQEFESYLEKLAQG